MYKHKTSEHIEQKITTEPETVKRLARNSKHTLSSDIIEQIETITPTFKDNKNSVPTGTGKPVEDGTEQSGHGYGTCERDSVERFPWFHGTCSVYSATREKHVFHGTYPSRFPRNKTGVFPPFL